MENRMKADKLRKLSMVVNIMYIVVALAEIVILVADMKNANHEEVEYRVKVKHLTRMIHL